MCPLRQPDDSPVGSQLLVTTSWDDGHPSDMHVADLLDRYGLNGTFYVPSHNSEGRPVMRPAEIVQLAERFEIAGHSHNHLVLTALTRPMAASQIFTNKLWLEDVTGREIHGFAYVHGRHNMMIRKLVAEAGFRYARTVKNLMSQVGHDRFQLGTTAQFFVHSNSTLTRNFVTYGPASGRLRILASMLGGHTLAARLLNAAKACARCGGYFHLWGHSWEIEEYDLWQELEQLLRDLNTLNVRSVANNAFHPSVP